MKEAGYSGATARNPKNLTQSDAWKELLGKALPDKKLLQVHKKILNAQKVEHRVFPLGMDIQPSGPVDRPSPPRRPAHAGCAPGHR